jgi:Tfp pilus assembly protein PilV
MKSIVYKNKYKRHQAGFTLVETVIAILILSLSIGSLLTLTAGGFFSVRYARNQIVADNLLQEALEYVRNSRDTAVQQGGSWATWLGTLNVDGSGVSIDLGSPSGCFVSDGCTIDPYTQDPKIRACSGQCPVTLFYPDEGFYGYATGTYPFSGGTSPVSTTYRRTVTTELITADELVVEATIQWQNGTTTKSVTQSLLLTNWNQL